MNPKVQCKEKKENLGEGTWGNAQEEWKYGTFWDKEPPEEEPKWDYIYKEDPWTEILAHIKSTEGETENYENPKLLLCLLTGGARESRAKEGDLTSTQS